MTFQRIKKQDRVPVSRQPRNIKECCVCEQIIIISLFEQNKKLHVDMLRYFIQEIALHQVRSCYERMNVFEDVKLKFSYVNTEIKKRSDISLSLLCETFR